MPSIRPLIAAISCLLMAALAVAANPDPIMLEVGPATPATPDKAIISTHPVLGGPLGNGDFEHLGLPDRDGWMTVEEMGTLGDAWHVDTHGAADLDPDQPDNHAYWCGGWFSCAGDPPHDGYGNNWNVALTWRGIANDPAQPVTVTVEAVLTHDTEPGYDYLYLEVQRADGWEVLSYWHESSGPDPLAVTETFTVQPADLEGDEVVVRWRFDSDGGYSDEDCLFLSDGAARLDNLQVFFDQGAGPELVSVDDAEPGTPRAWTGSEVFCTDAEAWPDLPELGTCWSWDSPVLAFLPDGSGCHEVQQGVNFTYGPDGQVIACPEWSPAMTVDYMISPAAPLPADWQDHDGALFEFDVYVHQAQLAGPFLWWALRTSDDGGQTWSAWRNHQVIYEHRGIVVRRFAFDVTRPLFDLTGTHVQVGLGMAWRTDIINFYCDNLTPAPWFDNVELSLIDRAGPDHRFRYSGNFSRPVSGFPAAGPIDPGQPAAAAVPWAASYDDPGYAVESQVAPSRADATITGTQLHWCLRANPAFDAVRTAAPPNPVPGVPAGQNDHIEDRVWFEYSYDLPDEGFLFPGDVLHFYVIAEEDRDGVLSRSVFPADTTAVGVFPGDDGFAPGNLDYRFEVQALPTVLDLPTLQTPPVLIWTDGEQATRDAWHAALAELDWTQGVDYDVLDRGWLSEPNADLHHYDLIVLDVGERWGFPDQVSLLGDWLDLGDRDLLVMGAEGFDPYEWRQVTYNWFGFDREISATGSDVRPLIDDQTAPVIAPASGSPLNLVTSFVADSRCHWNDLLAMIPINGGERFWEFLGPEGQTNHYTYAAGVQREWPNGSRGIALAFPLVNIDAAPGDPGDAATVRARVVEELFTALGHDDGGVLGARRTPGPQLQHVRAAPNPFNPRTEIRFSLGRDAAVEIALYDLRGRRVRSLDAGDLTAGAHALTWDGTDAAGRAVATGVYLAIVRAGAASESVKLTLVR